MDSSDFVCALPSTTNEVGDCSDSGVTVVKLVAGESLTGLLRVVRAGSIITIRVSDPNHRIALPDAQGRVPIARRFFVGVRSASGFYHPAVLTFSEDTEYFYTVTVPRQSSVRVSLDTALQMDDEFGRAVRTNGPNGISIEPAGRERIELRLAVR